MTMPIQLRARPELALVAILSVLRRRSAKRPDGLLPRVLQVSVAGELGAVEGLLPPPVESCCPVDLPLPPR